MRAHRPTAEFPAHLRELHRRFPLERSLADDPLSSVRPMARDLKSAEVAGIFAATLAIGNTTAIRGAIARLVERAGGDLTGYLGEVNARSYARAFAPFQHRWIRADQMGYLALTLNSLYRDSGSLQGQFVEGVERAGGFAGGLDGLARALRDGPRANGSKVPPPPRGYRTLFPSPLDAGRPACKRLTLFVRWMTRTEYPDLGVWTDVSPAELRIPLDQHVFWIAYHLGLTHRRTRNWATVEEVTEGLRSVDPNDPTKFDFVLCHTGISGDCPKERDLAICGACAVKPDCLMWRGRAAR